MKILLIGDYLTLQQMFIEQGEYSSLGKELAPNIWLLDALAQSNPLFGWLTGGDSELLAWFEAQSADVNSPQELRQLVHELTTQLMSQDHPLSLERRLRYLNKLPDTQGVIKDKPSVEVRLRQTWQDMYALLPGAYNARDEQAPYQWYEQRHKARWKPYDLLRPSQQSLLLGGLMRYRADAEHTSYYLRSPLVAYVIARQGLQLNQWRPHARDTFSALHKRHQEKVDEKTLPTSLDYFLDIMLNKALDISDGEEDHWTTAPFDGQDAKASGRSGYWWNRF
ncbi:MAG: hypothetical protein AAF512_24045 [Pseudomonadota bacterium]